MPTDRTTMQMHGSPAPWSSLTVKIVCGAHAFVGVDRPISIPGKVSPTGTARTQTAHGLRARSRKDGEVRWWNLFSSVARNPLWRMASIGAATFRRDSSGSSGGQINCATRRSLRASPNWRFPALESTTDPAARRQQSRYCVAINHRHLWDGKITSSPDVQQQRGQVQSRTAALFRRRYLRTGVASISSGRGPRRFQRYFRRGYDRAISDISLGGRCLHRLGHQRASRPGHLARHLGYMKPRMVLNGSGSFPG